MAIQMRKTQTELKQDQHTLKTCKTCNKLLPVYGRQHKYFCGVECEKHYKAVNVSTKEAEKLHKGVKDVIF